MGGNDLSTAKNISLRADKPIQDILQMKIGHQILFRRGSKPKIGRRYNTTENKLYKMVTKEYERQIAESQNLQMDPNGSTQKKAIFSFEGFRSF